MNVRTIRKPFVCLLLLLVLVLAAPAAVFGHNGHALRFENGHWWNGEEFVRTTFTLVDGKLAAAYDGEAETVDLHGGFVVPPFADAHRHAFAEAADIEKQRFEALRRGIFYVKNPHNLAAMAAKAASSVNRPTSVDVAYSHAGLTASGGHPIQIFESMAEQGHLQGVGELDGQAYFVIDTAADLDARWDQIVAAQPDFIKVVLQYSEEYEKRRTDPAYFGKRGLDPALVPAIVERAHASGLRVSAHVETAADFRNALKAGVDEINHLPLARLAAADAEEAARRDVVVVTTVLSHRSGGHDEGVEAMHKSNLQLLAAAGVRLAIGTDNNGVTAVDEVERLAGLGVLDSRALLQAWTETTAQTIFPERQIGRLADGWEASFLVLAGNPLDDFKYVRDIRLRVKQGQMLELPAEEPATPSIAEALMPLLHSGDIKAAVARYHELRRDEPAGWDFSEKQLNLLAYRMLGHHQVDTAIALFELNVSIFPRSPNARDSLGEAYIAGGKRQQAVEAYEKVLELLPEERHYAPEFRQQLEKNARTNLGELRATDG